MDLVDLQAFVRVAELGTVTSAAQALGVPKSTVSRRVARLEDDLGVALLHRGHRVKPTDEGERLLQSCADALAVLEAAPRTLFDAGGEPSGTLRITAPSDLGSTSMFSATLASFRRRWPAVRLDVVLTNRSVDLLEEGFDVALRAYRPPVPAGTGLRMQPLGAVPLVHVAAKTLIHSRGEPHTAEDVERLGLLVHPAMAPFVPEGLRPAVLISDFTQLLLLILDEAGVGAVPLPLAVPQLRAGALVRVLGAWDPEPGRVGLFWPAARHLAPRIRAFVDHATPLLRKGLLDPAR